MQKRKILVVEDNKINRDMLYEILHEQYSVILAENGQQGLNCLKENEDVEVSITKADHLMYINNKKY